MKEELFDNGDLRVIVLDGWKLSNGIGTEQFSSIVHCTTEPNL